MSSDVQDNTAGHAHDTASLRALLCTKSDDGSHMMYQSQAWTMWPLNREATFTLIQDLMALHHRLPTMLR